MRSRANKTRRNTHNLRLLASVVVVAMSSAACADEAAVASANDSANGARSTSDDRLQVPVGLEEVFAGHETTCAGDKNCLAHVNALLRCSSERFAAALASGASAGSKQAEAIYALCVQTTGNKFFDN